MLKDFNTPNLNAPRYREKEYNPVNKEFYKKLRATFPAYKRWSDSRIFQLIKASNEEIKESIIEHREGVLLPEGLGYLFVATCLPAKENIDYKSSREYKKEIQQRNWESDRYIAKIMFTTWETKQHFKNHDLYGFQASRQTKRDVSKSYPSRWKQYIQLDHTTKASKLFRKERFKDRKKKELEHLIKDYDEFDISSLSDLV